MLDKGQKTKDKRQRTKEKGSMINDQLPIHDHGPWTKKQFNHQASKAFNNQQLTV
jgi:hypothetical protein